MKPQMLFSNCRNKINARFCILFDKIVSQIEKNITFAELFYKLRTKMNRVSAINLIIIAALVVVAAVCASCKGKGSGDRSGSKSIITEAEESLAVETTETFNDPETTQKFEENDGVKLLKTIKSEYGSLTMFEYDDINRIEKMLVYENEELMGTYTISYSGNDLVSYSLSYDDDFSDYWGDVPGMSVQRRGNTIHVNEGGIKHTITVNDEEYIIEFKTEHPMAGVLVKNYQYIDDKLIKIKEENMVREINYDDKKSPLYNCNTPKWFKQYLLFDFAFKNNVTSWKIVEGTTDHQFEYENEYMYDSDGFPTKQTKTEKTMYDNEDGYVSVKITTFTYRGQ